MLGGWHVHVDPSFSRHSNMETMTWLEMVLIAFWLIGTLASVAAAGIRAANPNSVAARVLSAVAHALPSSNPTGVMGEMKQSKKGEAASPEPSPEDKK